MMQFGCLLISLLPAFSPTTTPPAIASSLVAGASFGPLAQVGGYGSTGVHGSLIVGSGQNMVIDLASQGTFDSANWVVRFDYVSVDIGVGATVSFTNHPSRAPVAWIVQGAVLIGQSAVVTVSGLNGTTGQNASFGYGEPGPGGFRGGRSTASTFDDSSSAGFGPGGAMGNPADTAFGGSGGSHGTLGLGGSDSVVASLGASYSGPAIFQLIGGSGGGAGRYSVSNPYSVAGGGGGGGALLVAADGIIDVRGSLRANGGSGGVAASAFGGGGGSGGAVRLASLAQVYLGATGTVNATGGLGTNASGGWNGGNGGFGRIRIEAPGGTPDLFGSITGQVSIGIPEIAFRTQPPRVWVALVGGVATPPQGGLTAGLGFGGESADMTLLAPGIVSIVVQSENLPLNSLVFLRISRAKGHATVLGPVALLSGTSVTFTNVDLSAGFSALQARAVLP